MDQNDETRDSSTSNGKIKTALFEVTKTGKVPSVVFKFDQTRHKVSVKQTSKTHKTHILWKKFQNCPISVSSNKHKKQVFLKRSTK